MRRPMVRLQLISGERSDRNRGCQQQIPVFHEAVNLVDVSILSLAHAQVIDNRRAFAISAAALVVLALLLFLFRGDEANLSSTEAMNGTGTEQSDTTSPPSDDITPPAQPSEETPVAVPPTSPPARTDTTGEGATSAPPSADAAATGQLLISVDTPSMVTIDGDAVGRFLPGVPRTVTAPLGQRLVIATADDGATRDQAVVDLNDAGAQRVVVLELADELTERVTDATARERENALRSATVSAEENRGRREAEAAARDPFPDQGDGTLLDRQAGLRWTTASAPGQGSEGLLWTDANDYCEGLSVGRTSDWRLPTRPELDSVLQRLDPARYPWGLTLWSADRVFGEPNRLWVTNSPVYAPEWSTAVRDASARRLTHRAVCVASERN